MLSLSWSQESNRRGWTHPRRRKSLVSRAYQISPELIAVAVQIHRDCLDLPQVTHHIRPGHLGFAFLESLLQVHLQSQGQETGDNVTNRRIIIDDER